MIGYENSTPEGRLLMESVGMDLDKRKAEILIAVVKNYIKTAEPVSSQTIVAEYGFNLSSATVRHELAALESMGYLTHPHTSAGRVPTDKGYRFFVNSIKELGSSMMNRVNHLRTLYQRRDVEIEKLLKDTADLLASVTRHVALIMAPSIQTSTFKHLELLPIGEKLAMMVLITGTGRILKKVFQYPSAFNSLDLQRVAGLFNARFSGIDMEKIEGADIALSSSDLLLRPLVNQVRGILAQETTGFEEERVFLSGTSFMLQQPEFYDMSEVQSILDILEREYFLLNLLRDKLSENKIVVKIGSEIERDELRHCSFVLTNYKFRGRRSGTVGVIGPTRMDYPRVISTIHFFEKSLTEYLNSFQV